MSSEPMRKHRRILYLIETWNPQTMEIESLIFWSGLTPQELKAHASDNLLVITGVFLLTSSEVPREY